MGSSSILHQPLVGSSMTAESTQGSPELTKHGDVAISRDSHCRSILITEPKMPDDSACAQRDPCCCLLHMGIPLNHFVRSFHRPMSLISRNLIHSHIEMGFIIEPDGLKKSSFCSICLKKPFTHCPSRQRAVSGQSLVYGDLIGLHYRYFLNILCIDDFDTPSSPLCLWTDFLGVTSTDLLTASTFSPLRALLV